MSIIILVVGVTENGNNYGTTLFGDGARFGRGGGRQVRGPVTRWNLMATRRSDETFLSLQALSSSHFVRRRRPFSTKCVWNHGNFFGSVALQACGVVKLLSEIVGMGPKAMPVASFVLFCRQIAELGRHNSAALPGAKLGK